MQIHRGDKVLVSLDRTIGSEQGKTRPALVIQNDIGNKFSPTTIVLPITSNTNKIHPTDTKISKQEKVLTSQIRTIDKKRIIKKLGKIRNDQLQTVEKALKISLHL